MKSLLPLAGPLVGLAIAGCVVSAGGPAPTGRDDRPQSASARPVDQREAQRLYSIMTPLLRVMDRPKSPRDVQIGIMDTPEINAANAGGGVFYVPPGSCQKLPMNNCAGFLPMKLPTMI
jgi:hypothetical protein